MKIPPLLLIEDEPEMIDTILNTIQDFNPSLKYEVAIDGRSALNELRSRCFSLVLLDLNLPIADGFDILKEIKPLYATPVIVTSSSTNFDDILTCYTLGASAYLSKGNLNRFTEGLTLALDLFYNFAQRPWVGNEDIS